MIARLPVIDTGAESIDADSSEPRPPRESVVKMSSLMALRILLAIALVIGASDLRAQTAKPPDPIDLFVARLESLAAKGDRDGLAALGEMQAAGSPTEDFAKTMTPAPSQVVIKERDRTPLLDGSQRLLLEVFSRQGGEGRVGTWQADVRPTTGGASDPAAWRIVGMERLSLVTGLYRLSLDTVAEFDVHDLIVNGPDLTLQLASGTAFVATTSEGPTAVVLLGRGRMRFAPSDAAERTQLRIFSGEEQLDAEFTALFLRMRPSDFDSSFPSGTLTPRAVGTGDLKRATELFEDFVGLTLNLDLNDMSRDRWSLLPQSGDLIAEIRTRKFGDLTYTRVQGDSEDITVFDRRHRKNIAVYASQEKLAARGRFYSEDDQIDYDVLSYDIETDFTPDRLWINGRATLGIRVVAPAIASVTLRIANPLAVRSVFSPSFGRLMHLRIVGQNSVIVNLPVSLMKGTNLTLQLLYSGRVEPQELEREAIQFEAQEQDTFVLQAEPRFIYSNRSYWYPQSTVTDYATARLQISVPPEFDAVASGTPTGPPAPAPGPVRPGERPRKMFVFQTSRPVRYLACVISRFTTVTTADLILPGTDASRRAAMSVHGPRGETDPPETALSLIVQANPRQTSRARGTAERTAAIFRFYASLMGEVPYPSFTIALSESALPGGHSPAYFAVLNQALPTSPFVWRNDPVSFDNYPSFFLAHELAHQWWGQAIGWKNYHEQWLSEGFAQYFAAMYAQEERGSSVFAEVLRQMRRWAIEASPQGPIYLGYRLGHIKSDGRVFRAVLYNKSAMVLHMLRRLVGDAAFFKGLRTYYGEWRYAKAGTDDFRLAMEKASGVDLQPFFDAWIFGVEIPRLRLTSAVEGSTATITLEHRGPVMPTPVSVTLVYGPGDVDTLVVLVTERTATRTVPLRGTLRDVQVNQDYGALAVIEK
jgi:hypothetical protein